MVRIVYLLDSEAVVICSNFVSIGQLKRLELILYGTSGIYEDTIDVQRSQTDIDTNSKWPGVKTSQLLPSPRFSYISKVAII